MDKVVEQTLTKQAVTDMNAFWAAEAHQRLSWFSPWTEVLQGDFTSDERHWFINGTLNACFNCVDRHLATRANQVALIFEGNEPGQARHFTYQALHLEICRFANILKTLNVKKGDRVCIYLPTIPEAVFAMLACARIGAIHSVIFAGFSSEALKTRIMDADCRVLITADTSVRGDKIIHLKDQVDMALEDCPNVEHVVVIQHTGHPIAWYAKRDQWYTDLREDAADVCPVEPLLATDPLFILYTSGSTGTPKGVVHNVGGYLVYVVSTFHQVFQIQPGDVYWCTADMGWITGHSYLVYAPLAAGTTTVLYDGIPSYPTFSRYWDIIDQHHVTQFYTSPTALRALRRAGDDWVLATSRKSLKLLGSVGEPLNPDVWTWFHEVIGQGRCSIVNTWWQTETGGILLTPLPDNTSCAPGSAGKPLLGIEADIVDETGHSVAPGQSGRLVIKKPWPGLMQTIYKHHQKFVDNYLKPVPGCYLSGDAAFCDEQGLYWIIGRLDDVLNVAGHRIGTEEVESALISEGSVAEAAVIGVPDEIRGEKIYAFVTLRLAVSPTEGLKQTLIQHVRQTIGPFAAPSVIRWTTALPKTRSGKIMRRLLRHIANHDWDKLGDLSTLANPESIESLTKEST